MKPPLKMKIFLPPAQAKTWLNEVIGRRKNQTILACSSVKTVSPKIVTVYVQSATSIDMKSTHQKKKTRRKK